jgi:5-methylcytosine-specific restriction protein A
MAPQGFTERIRKILDERAKGKCEKCGLPATHVQYHHRRPRGMGGSKRANTNEAGNALVLHFKCHADIESNRKHSLLNGWLVSQHQEPLDVPVLLHYGWVYLMNDGEAVPQELFDGAIRDS